MLESKRSLIPHLSTDRIFKMGAKLQARDGRMLDLNMLRPILRAYALGYASSTIPRLLGLLRTLRRQDRTIQEKLDLVSYASAFLSNLNFQSSPIAMPPPSFR